MWRHGVGDVVENKIRSYRDLRVWQDAMALAEACYMLTKRFPRDELFGLTSQARRSAGSVPANIAEGYGRESRKSFIQSLRIAQGSLKELETHPLLAQRVGITDQPDVSPLLERCESLGKMLRTLIRKLQQKDAD